MTELGCHPADEGVLDQASEFSERTFISDAAERKLILALLSGSVDMSEFVKSKVLKSDNAKLIVNLVKHINGVSPLSVPEVYRQFIADITKALPVAGLLQVTSVEPLKILNDVAEMRIDIFDARNAEKLNILRKSLPTVWPQLSAIQKHEKSEFLPQEVRKIVIKLIYVRRQTFIKAPKRRDGDYFEYQGPEDNTQCYPLFPLVRYPSRYDVGGKADDDHCEKSFPAHKDWLEGIFTIGISEFSPAMDVNISNNLARLVTSISSFHLKFLLNIHIVWVHITD